MANDEVAAFWADMEKRIGEKISIYVMGTYIEGFGNQPGPVLGIFFLSETALHFVSFKKENWLFGIFARRSSSMNEEPLEFNVPFSAMRHMERSAPPPVRNFFFPESPRIAITCSLNPGVLSKLVISIDIQEKDFLSQLKSKLNL